MILKVNFSKCWRQELHFDVKLDNFYLREIRNRVREKRNLKKRVLIILKNFRVSGVIVVDLGILVFTGNGVIAVTKYVPFWIDAL